MFRKVKDWVKTHKTAFALIITALFVAVHIPLILTHENWNDEAVSWALSREINLSNIYEINNAEPHPLLWQLILAPFSKLGLPFDTISYISLALVALAVFLFIRFAPMNGFVKFAFLISAGFFYFLPVISRDYSLVPLAIALMCIAYKNRHKKPFLYGLSIAFLTQTHFLMYGLAAALGVGFVIEEIVKKEDFSKRLKRTAIFALPIAISLASVIPIVINSFNNQAIISGKAYETVAPENMDQLAPKLMKSLFGSDMWGVYVAIFVIVVMFAISLLSKNVKTFLYLVAGESFWFYVMFNIYKGYYVLSPKAALIVLILLASVWTTETEEKNDKENLFSRLLNVSEIIKYIKSKNVNLYMPLAAVLAISTTPNTIANAKMDYETPFSNAKEISAIMNEFEDGALIIQADPTAVVETAVREYVTKNFVYYNYMYNKVEEPEDYLKYDNNTISTYSGEHLITNEELISLLAYAINTYDHVYYFAQTPDCGTYSKVNEEILDKLENIATINLNNGIHMDIPRPAVNFYKVK